MILEERRIVTVVRRCVTGRERLQCSAWTVADAFSECLNALYKAWADVRLVQQHTGQHQHQIQLLCVIHRQSIHGGFEVALGDGRIELSQKLRNSLPSLFRCDGIETMAQQSEQKHALPERVGAIPDQRQRRIPEGPEVG